MGPTRASPVCASRTLLLVGFMCFLWEVACMPRTDLGEQSGGASSGSGISALGRTGG